MLLKTHLDFLFAGEFPHRNFISPWEFCFPSSLVSVTSWKWRLSPPRNQSGAQPLSRRTIPSLLELTQCLSALQAAVPAEIPAQSVSKLDLWAQLELSGFCAMEPSGKRGQSQQMDSIFPVMFRRHSKPGQTFHPFL